MKAPREPSPPRKATGARRPRSAVVARRTRTKADLPAEHPPRARPKPEEPQQDPSDLTARLNPQMTGLAAVQTGIGATAGGNNAPGLPPGFIPPPR